MKLYLYTDKWQKDGGTVAFRPEDVRATDRASEALFKSDRLLIGTMNLSETPPMPQLKLVISEGAQ